MKLRARKQCFALIAVFFVLTIVASAQTFETLVNFDADNGASPYLMSLIQGRDGLLYGTTIYGGSYGDGTAFKLAVDGELTTLHEFSGEPDDGRFADDGLAQGADGEFYGTTNGGGLDDYGIVYSMTSSGLETILYDFLCSESNCGDGAEPISGLVLGADGAFYGTTNQGGGNGASGTVFRITRDGALTTIYRFCTKAHCVDGAQPYATLIQAEDGGFYGTTYAGGGNNSGTVFKINASGVLNTLHSFNGNDGSNPTGALLQATDGNIYGATSQGGLYGHGTVFRLTRSGFRTLHNFCSKSNCTDGDRPQSGLIQGTDGILYGTTFQGGTRGFGTVFRIDSKGQFAILHDFDFHVDGGQLYGGLTQVTNGLYYGTTFAGGANNFGTVFSLDVGLGPFVTFVRPAGRVGETGPILGQGFTGTTDVSLNGTPAKFTIVSDTFIRATVPPGATTGYVTVTTPTGTLTSNKKFVVLP